MQIFLERAGITSGIAFFIGALKTGDVLVGPVEETLPPVPGWLRFDRTHEMVGIGTIFTAEGKLSLHLHGSLGRESSSPTECLRTLDYPTFYEQFNPAHRT
jgi:hypothetical protein